MTIHTTCCQMGGWLRRPHGWPATKGGGLITGALSGGVTAAAGAGAGSGATTGGVVAVVAATARRGACAPDSRLAISTPRADVVISASDTREPAATSGVTSTAFHRRARSGPVVTVRVPNVGAVRNVAARSRHTVSDAWRTCTPAAASRSG